MRFQALTSALSFVSFLRRSTTMKSFIVGAIVASAGLFSASSAAAAFIVNPVSATSSINNSGYSPNNTILGYPTSGLTAGSPWPTATSENLGGGVGYWQEYAPYSGLSIQWDLGRCKASSGCMFGTSTSG